MGLLEGHSEGFLWTVSRSSLKDKANHAMLVAASLNAP